MELVISTSQGLEDFLIKELNDLGYSAKYLKPSKVLLNGTEKDIVKLNFYLRQAHRVGILLEKRTFENLNSLKLDLDLSWLPKGLTFGVRGRRFNKEGFTSMELAKKVADLIYPHLKEPKVDLDNPQLEFFAEVSGNQFILYLNTSGPSLHKRYKRPYQHVAPLKPSIAASLIYASSFHKTKELLDPMAGSGTILQEACYISRKVPPGLFREHYNYEYFFPHLSQLKDELYFGTVVEDINAYLEGGDISPKHLEGMKKNLKEQIIPCDCIDVYLKDAKKLNYPYVPELVITNPPYGLRMGSKNKIHKLYEEFAKALYKNDVREVITFTAEQTKMIRELKKYYEIKEIRRVLYGRLNTYLIKATL